MYTIALSIRNNPCAEPGQKTKDIQQSKRSSVLSTDAFFHIPCRHHRNRISSFVLTQMDHYQSRTKLKLTPGQHLSCSDVSVDYDSWRCVVE